MRLHYKTLVFNLKTGEKLERGGTRSVTVLRGGGEGAMRGAVRGDGEGAAGRGRAAGTVRGLLGKLSCGGCKRGRATVSLGTLFSPSSVEACVALQQLLLPHPV